MTLAAKPPWLTGGPLGASLSLLREAFDAFNEDKAPRLGAALAYFSLFSLAPLFIILSSIAGLVFGEAQAQAHLFEIIRTLVGTSGAETVRSLAVNANRTGGGWLTTLLGTLLLLLGASGAFLQLTDALNSVWGLRIKPKGSIWHQIEQQFIALISVLVTGGLLALILFLSTYITLLARFVEGSLPGGPLLWQGINYLLSFALLTVLFAMMFEYLPSAILAWRDAWAGAAFTSGLFSLGIVLLGIYIGKTNLTTTFGASSSLVIILLWVFYSAQILLFGAEFTKVLAKRHGRPIRPDDRSLPILPAPMLPVFVPREPEQKKQKKQKKQEKQEPILGLWLWFALCLLCLLCFLVLCAFSRLRKSPLLRGGLEKAS